MPRPKENIWNKLEDKKWIIGECWRWLGACNNLGRPYIRYEDRSAILVTRLIMHLSHGFDLDSKLMILHKPECIYKDCWNPEHLYIGNHMDNMLDYANAENRFTRDKPTNPAGRNQYTKV